MSEKIEISLIGAGSYGTLTKVFQKGTPAFVSPQEWDTLMNEANPSDGSAMFCLTSELPAAPIPDHPDIQSSDLRSVGLGEIDTGEVTMAQALAGDSGMSLDELDDLPSDETDLGGTETQPSAEVGYKVVSDPAPALQVPAPSRKVTIGKQSKSVQV